MSVLKKYTHIHTHCTLYMYVVLFSNPHQTRPIVWQDGPQICHHNQYHHSIIIPLSYALPVHTKQNPENIYWIVNAVKINTHKISRVIPVRYMHVQNRYSHPYSYFFFPDTVRYVQYPICDTKKRHHKYGYRSLHTHTHTGYIQWFNTVSEREGISEAVVHTSRALTFRFLFCVLFVNEKYLCMFQMQKRDKQKIRFFFVGGLWWTIQ